MCWFSRKSLVLSAVLPLLTGCSFFVHVRKFPVPKPPSSIETATAAELVAMLNKRAADIHSFSATVDIHAVVTSEAKGEIRDYTEIRGYLLYREPQQLRVLGLMPVVHTKAFDLASSGDDFKLYIPVENKAFAGKNSAAGHSKNTFENLRPSMFLDAFLLHGAVDGENYFLISETKTIESEDRKHLFADPEYELTITRAKTDGKELKPVRVIHLHREHLDPFEQDIYDDDGNLVTQVIYGPNQQFGDTHFPGFVTIRRPIDKYEITLTIDKFQLNQTLADDQFVVEIPEKTPVQQLK